jgi:glycosyltransferase involved in cell wall biosynthesis
MKKLFIVVNVDWFFLSHRKDIAVEAQRNGFDVTVVANNTGRKTEIEALGLRFINLPLSKSNKNIFKELHTLLFLYILYRQNKPGIIHHVGIKLILCGTVAAKFAHINGVLNAVTGGLGVSFLLDHTSVFSRLMIYILKFSHKQKNLAIIFQNDEDKHFFLDHAIIQEDQAFNIKGSGIDLNIFKSIPEPENDKIKILFTARMLKEKGVFELINAADLLKDKYKYKIQFLLCGGIDDNPTAIPQDELEAISDGQYIIWLGYKTNVRKLLEECHIMAFPSYYREGLPKSLIEACAVGRPIVTTDSVGCKDAVIDGYNGFLVPIKDSKILAEKLEILIKNKPLRIKMGMNSRQLAERYFSIENVIEKHMEIYNLLKNQTLRK